MNLVDGKMLASDECESVLDSLEERILVTLSKDRLRPGTVVAACDRLAKGLDEAAYLAKMGQLGISPARGRQYIAEAREMFRAEALQQRLQTELGNDLSRVEPLGTLLHVAAGNMDGLPAFSVLEGLLTGNINILKLPAEEGGVSVGLLAELIREEPTLAEYIYVFDYSSRDVLHIRKLLAAADAVVVWGGDEAVAAFRAMVKPNTKLIEWGHKVSFGYVTRSGLTDEGLSGFARNIAETGQMLCSSCQGLFLDTDDMGEVHSLCGRFAALLAREVAGFPSVGLIAQATLELYTAELESLATGGRVYRSQGCGVIARSDSKLESAPAPRVPWVKPLPRERILRSLYPYKNHLQTVGLLCGEGEREALARQFFKTGVVRVTTGGSMSRNELNMPHDGEYPLRRYVKVTHLD